VKFIKKLITLLKLFKNRPHHLAKYLIDNDALNSEFTNSLINSNKISKISKDKIDKYNNFSDISTNGRFLWISIK